MTEFRQTLLWIIFAGSLFMLYEGWQTANGRPSMLRSAPAKTAIVDPARGVSSAAPAAGGTAGAVPTAASAVSTPATVPATAASAPTAATAPTTPIVPREQVTVITDVMKATFDSQGGELVRVEFLKHPAAEGKPGGVV